MGSIYILLFSYRILVLLVRDLDSFLEQETYMRLGGDNQTVFDRIVYTSDDNLIN